MKHFLVISLFLLPLVSMAQDKTRILFVFDASNSMNGYWGHERKIETATRLLSASLAEVYQFENLELGLRVYGHQTQHVQGKQDCDDTELVVPIASGNNLIIKKELSRIQPKGTTPIARSLERAAEDFSDCPDCRNIIILITDGIEACDEDPCAVSKALQAKNIIVRPFIIGIGIEDKYKKTFECVGNFFDATDPETFEVVLDLVVTEALNNTSVQIDLLDGQKKPTISDVPVTLYNSKTGEVMYNFVHTLNAAGLPDTLSLDPLPVYKLVVHTYPPLIKEGLTVNPGEHTVFSVDAAQGTLALDFSTRKSEHDKIQCIVRPHNACEEIHYQQMGSREKYLVGRYDLEILTLPPTIITDVEITEGSEFPVVIPTPGIFMLNTGTSGYGSIMLENEHGLETVVRFAEGNPGGRYYLQPGNYRLVFRARAARQTIYSVEKKFTIKSGVTTTINLN